MGTECTFHTFYFLFLIYIDAFIIDLQYHGENYSMFTSEWTTLQYTTKKTWRGFCIHKRCIFEMYSSHKNKCFEEEISVRNLSSAFSKSHISINFYSNPVVQLIILMDIKYWFLLSWKLYLKVISTRLTKAFVWLDR